MHLWVASVMHRRLFWGSLCSCSPRPPRWPRSQRLIGRPPTSSNRRSGRCSPSIATSAIPPGANRQRGPAPRQHGRPAQRGRHGPRGRARRSRGQPALEGDHVQRRHSQNAAEGQLPAAAIATLTQWVKEGADVAHDVEPMRGKKPPGLDFEAARSHWAYQPIRRPSIPTVQNRGWMRSPVDVFVLASLEKAGLDPSPAADRRTLIRRAYYDLTGLPPTTADIEAFENDKCRTRLPA